MQFVLLLALLVSEVIIQQHQLLQKGCFDSYGLPITAVAAAAGGACAANSAAGPAYQPLPGSAADAGDVGSSSGSSRARRPAATDKRQLRYQPWWVRLVLACVYEACMHRAYVEATLGVPCMASQVVFLRCLPVACVGGRLLALTWSAAALGAGSSTNGLGMPARWLLLLHQIPHACCQVCLLGSSRTFLRQAKKLLISQVDNRHGGFRGSAWCGAGHKTAWSALALWLLPVTPAPATPHCR